MMKKVISFALVMGCATNLVFTVNTDEQNLVQADVIRAAEAPVVKSNCNATLLLLGAAIVFGGLGFIAGHNLAEKGVSVVENGCLFEVHFGGKVKGIFDRQYMANRFAVLLTCSHSYAQQLPAEVICEGSVKPEIQELFANLSSDDNAFATYMRKVS